MKNSIKILSGLFIIIGFCHNSVAQDALHFDGVDDYVEVPPFALNNLGPDQFTFEAWVQGSELGSAHPVIFSNRQYVSGSWTGAMFLFHGFWSGSAHKMLAVQLGGINYMIYNNGSAGKILDGNCHHVAIAREGNILIFMVDGVDIGTRTIVGNPTTNSTVPMLIGKDNITASTKFNGKIRSVRIFDRTRNWPEVASEMNVQLPMGTPNLMGNWELNNGFGQIAFDQSGFGADGILGTGILPDVADPMWSIMPCHPYRSQGSLAVNEVYEEENSILLFPNPVTSTLSIEFKESIEGVDIKISNSIGEIVYEEANLNQPLLEIPVEHLSSGFYIVHFSDENGLIQMKKFSKK